MIFVNFGIIHLMLLGILFSFITFLFVLKLIILNLSTKQQITTKNFEKQEFTENIENENPENEIYKNFTKTHDPSTQEKKAEKNKTNWTEFSKMGSFKISSLDFFGNLDILVRNIIFFGLIFHIIYYFWNHFTQGTFTLAKYLPLHICNLSTYLLVIAILGIKLNKKWSSQYATLVYYWSLIPASLALIFPDLQSRDIWNFEFIEFFWSHTLIVAGCFYLLFFGNLKTNFKFVPLAIVILAVFGLGLIYPLNLALGSNYMYLNRLTATGPMSQFPTPPLHLLVFIFLLLFFYSGQFLVLRILNFIWQRYFGKVAGE